MVLQSNNTITLSEFLLVFFSHLTLSRKLSPLWSDSCCEMTNGWMSFPTVSINKSIDLNVKSEQQQNYMKFMKTKMMMKEKTKHFESEKKTLNVIAFKNSPPVCRWCVYYWRMFTYRLYATDPWKCMHLETRYFQCSSMSSLALLVWQVTIWINKTTTHFYRTIGSIVIRYTDYKVASSTFKFK